MDNDTILLCAVFVPVVSSLIIPLAGRLSSPLRNIVSLIAVLVSFACSAALVPTVLDGGTVAWSANFAMGFNMSFAADALAVFMALVSSFISAIIVLYSFGYISHYENQNEYYFMVVLFLGSMMGICYSSNLIYLYLFWEITAFTSWRLIGFFREREFVLKADKAFMVTVFGALVMLLGFIMIYQQKGTFDLADIRASEDMRSISGIAVALILAGILSKSATLPFHTWLPDAGIAPTPVTALLHAAVLVKIGVYVYARLFVATFTIDAVWTVVVPVIAAASALVSAGAAFIETDIKRIIAYSTVSQIGFIFLGLSLGTEVGIAGGLLYILMHGLAKAGLFLSAGIIEHGTHTRDITKLGGLIRTMPVTAVSFLVCAFSVMGIPPFGGFFSKYLVINAAVDAKQVAIGLVFLFGALFTIVYLFRLFYLVFLKDGSWGETKEGSRVMVGSVAALAVFSLAGGIFIYYPSFFVDVAVKQMLGM